jgi:ribosome maturation factor RimP
MIDKKKVVKLIDERMQELDAKLYLVDLSISASNVIHVTIDKTEGRVSIEECISVSRNIEKNLDREKEDLPEPLHPAMTSKRGLCMIKLRCYLRRFICST